MFDPAAPPGWILRGCALASRLGFARSVALLSGALVLGVLGLTQAGLLLGGAGLNPRVLLLAGCCALLAAPLLSAWLVQLMFQLESARRQQGANVAHDVMTGTPTRRHFMQLAEREWSRCRRYGEDGALLLVEADHFHQVRASQGAACGDALLRDITRHAARTLRHSDLLARYASDTLIVFLPNTDPLGALDVAERMRERVAGHSLRWHEGGVSSTLSVGVASVGAAHLTLETLAQDAQSALQVARDAGRNCVRAAPVQPRPVGNRSATRASGGRTGPH
jgi:diguanylate cyclase (GGDEF)-like protein